MLDTSKFLREKIGSWNLASDISSLGITLQLLLLLLEKSMISFVFFLIIKLFFNKLFFFWVSDVICFSVSLLLIL